MYYVRYVYGGKVQQGYSIPDTVMYYQGRYRRTLRTVYTLYPLKMLLIGDTVHKGFYIDSSPGFIPYIIVLQNDSRSRVLRKFKAGVLLEKNVRKTYPPLLLSNGFSEDGLYDFCRIFFGSFNLKQRIFTPKNVLFLATLFG